MSSRPGGSAGPRGCVLRSCQRSKGKGHARPRFRESLHRARVWGEEAGSGLTTGATPVLSSGSLVVPAAPAVSDPVSTRCSPSSLLCGHASGPAPDPGSTVREGSSLERRGTRHLLHAEANPRQQLGWRRAGARGRTSNTAGWLCSLRPQNPGLPHTGPLAGAGLLSSLGSQGCLPHP